MSIGIKAIPTRYAGCHFRSRLEARWAVFFDTLGVAWQYEPEGFEVGWRLEPSDPDQPEPTFLYLPDFWLPDSGMWVEVKGSLTDDECLRLLNAAAWLSSEGGGGCGQGGNVLILGPLPHPEHYVAPTALHMHKGSLLAYPYRGEHSGCHAGLTVADDCGGGPEELGIRVVDVTLALLGGGSYLERIHLMRDGRYDESSFRLHPNSRWRAAITAARSARFEHGEAGAT